ncbi:hypothetical protein K0M31_016388, partial [Melipona bicolor]
VAKLMDDRSKKALAGARASSWCLALHRGETSHKNTQLIAAFILYSVFAANNYDKPAYTRP